MPDETVKVMVRCRPMNKKEKDRSCNSCVNVDQKNNTINLVKPGEADNQKLFTYDYVFPPEVSQQSIYEASAFSLVESVVEGYNGTIFAYGQTGCGKTFTMLGDPTKDEFKGIIPRSFQHIVNIISVSSDKKFLVRCSYLEIYNEDIHDLLGVDTRAKMELKESADKGVFVKDLTMNIVKSVEEMNKWMDQGTKNRSTGETLMNRDSSRSHSIFTLFIECSMEDEKGEEKFTAGKLNLVDLAGSERQSKTGATGDRLKEATKINLSLSALGNVISALVDGKSTHIPYRDSKLTRLLQDSLGGNTKTIMIAAISPADYNYDESLSTLRYASRAKQIKNQPKINEDPKDALLREYAEEIKKLKEMLLQQQQNKGGEMYLQQQQQQPPPQQIIVEVQVPVPVQQTQDQQQKAQISKEEFEKQEQEKQELEKLKREKSIELKKLQDQNSELNKYREKMEEEMKRKEEAFINEKIEREKIEKLMKDVSQKMMVGGKGNDEESKKYNQMKLKLQKQEKEHEHLLEEKRKKEEQALQFEKKYNSLQEEVEEMRRIIQDLHKKYNGAMKEIKDLEKENEGNRGELLESIRSLEKDVKLYSGIARMMLNNDELEAIRGACTWNDDKQEYKVPPFYFKEKKLKFPKLSNAQAYDFCENEKEGREIEIIKDEDEDQSKYDQQSQNDKKLGNLNSTNQKRNFNNNNNQTQNFDYFDDDMRLNGENFRYQNYDDPIMQEKAKLKQKFMKQQQKPQTQKQEKKNLPKVLEPMSDQQIDKIQEKLDKHQSAQAFINPVFFDKNKLSKQNQLKPIQSYKNLEQSSTANTDSLEMGEEYSGNIKNKNKAKLDKINVDSVR